MQNASMPRRYLALWFPWLPCERVRKEAGRSCSTPLALVARSGNALRLSAVDAQAARLGLSPGMTLADARARCPELESLPHDEQADTHTLERLTARMVRFTPMAAPDLPHGVMLDITACAHLFGGEAELARQVLAEAGFTARHAFADHAAAARALVRFGEGETIHPASSSLSSFPRRRESRSQYLDKLPTSELDPRLRGDDEDGGKKERIRALPIAALELPEDALSGLRRAGLVTLGDLAARPMAALAARFGEDTVSRLLAVLGERDTPLTPQRPPVRLRAQVRFPEPIGRTEDVLDVIETLLAELSRQMEERRLGGRRFVVRLERTDGARRRLSVDTSLPSRDPARIVRLFRERIETLSDPLDPGFGFDAVALGVTRADPLDPVQSDITGKASAEAEGIAVLIDRLTTRFGEGGVLRLAARDTHRPEAAQRHLPALRARPKPWNEPPSQPRPLFLLDPPQPITAMASVPDGPPHRLHWRGRTHRLVFAEGPERIAAEWWRKPDGHVPGAAGLTRDYYRVEDEEGARYWVFRHGLYDEAGNPRWYLHGLFA